MAVYELEQTDQLVALYTIIRDEKTKRDEFIFCADRIIRLLVEKATEFLPTREKTIRTPTESEYAGKEFVGKICAVSIVRSGEAMEKAVRDICQKIRIGKILIQRDENTAKPILFYHKLPEDIAERYVLLLDPMLATGGSAVKAVEILKGKGVNESKIIFVNLISCPEGIKEFTGKYPEVKVITGVIDKSLNEKAYILPGLGDFGDRYFGT
ncbi:MAG: uracil phosphoribosyltransferase [Candidatus Nanoarchaeia archaeon]|nr:uracil phosphoribosyltransferase [Candidatus Nanoarchaeia archaeon]